MNPPNVLSVNLTFMISAGVVAFIILSAIVSLICIARVRRRRRAIAQSFAQNNQPATSFSGNGHATTLQTIHDGASPYGETPSNTLAAYLNGGAPAPARTCDPPQPGVSEQQQALLDRHSHMARNDADARRPLLMPEAADDAVYRGGAVDVPPPAYAAGEYSASSEPLAMPSPHSMSAVLVSSSNRQDAPIGSPNASEVQGREVRREERNRGTVLEYTIN